MRNVWIPALGLIVPEAACLMEASAQAIAQPPQADARAASNITSYAPEFFSEFRPNTAMDMINRVPGFAFEGGSSARGFSGTAGNVIIDGERPPSRGDTLFSVLSRIPAGAVDRIDIVRGSADGIDMQGRAIVANVIRKRTTGLSGAVSGGATVTSRGKSSFNGQIEVEDDRDGRLLAGSASASWNAGNGRSFRQRIAPSGALILDAASRSENEAQNASVTGLYEGLLLGGKLRLNGQVARNDTNSSSDEVQTVPSGFQVAASDVEVTSGELGLRYTRLIAGTGVEVVGFQSLQTTKSNGLLNAPTFISGANSTERRGESIVRTSLQPPSFGSFSIEAGVEGVYNFTESDAVRILDGEVFGLAGDAFQADELRAEGFATLSWKPSPQFNSEIGARYEWSRISADVSTLTSENEFQYLKPRLIVSWSPLADQQFNLRIERIVDQLSFSGFASTASFENSIFGIGNPDIAPERSWVFESRYEAHFGGQNSFVAKYTHRSIEDVLGRTIIRISSAPDQPAQIFEITRNVGRAKRDQLDLTGNVELDRFGLPGGLLIGGLSLRESDTTDPVTLEHRNVSGDISANWNLSLQQTLVGGAFRWAIFFQDGEDSFSWAPRSITKNANLGLVGANIRWKLAPAWTLNAGVNDILKRVSRSWSVFYSDGRDIGIPLYLERGESHGTTTFFVNLRKDF